MSMLPSSWSVILLLVFTSLSSAESVSNIGADVSGKHLSLQPTHRAFLKEHPQITASCVSHLEPLEFIEDGSCQGYSTDLLLLMADKVGLEVRFEPYDAYTDVYSALLMHDIDMMQLASEFIIHRFSSVLSQAYFDVHTVLVTHYTKRDIKDMSDLSGRRVAFLHGALRTKAAILRNPTIDIIEFKDVKAMLDALRSGEVDAMVSDYTVVNHMIQKYDLTDLKIAGHLDALDIVDTLAYGMRSDRPLLKEIMDIAMGAITEAEMRDLEEKWFRKSARLKIPIGKDGPMLSKMQRWYLQEKRELTMCVPPEQAPLVTFEDGGLGGMAGEYVDYFEKRLKVAIKPVVGMSTTHSTQIGMGGGCDIHLLMQESPRYQGELMMTSSYIDDSTVIVTRADEAFFVDLHALHGKRIAAIKGVGGLEDLVRSYPDLEVVWVEDVHDAIERVLDGELYGLAYSMIVLNEIVKREYPDRLRISGQLAKRSNWSIGVRQSEPVLYDIFDRLISGMPSELQEEIRTRWLFTRQEPSRDYALIWKIGITSAVLVLIVLYWNRRLLLHRRELDVKNRELEDEKVKVDHIAYHDTLTGLLNRVSISKAIDHAISVAHAQENLLVILFIDLDRFKNVNDTLGHHIGDEMLKVVGQRLDSVLYETDILARLGGDEFIVLLEGIKEQKEAALVAEKILLAIKETIPVNGYDLNTTASIGIAVYPDDGDDTNTLIKNADSAMYLAKKEGKNGYRYYTKQLSDEVHERLTLEHLLRNAIEKEEFSLEYQPQYDLQTHKIVAAEALLRWDRHDREVIAPDRFIPIAEDSGIILSIGRWVFVNACKEFLRWKALGLDVGRIAINVSSVQFIQKDVVEQFREMIDSVGIDAKYVEIELTERYVMEHTEHNLNILQELREIGFHISIDDFGTGYSSMSYLKRLPLDTIKIDKAFIEQIPNDLNDVAITKAILVLAKSLEYPVVAEGIEFGEQESFLKEQQCNIGQGYHFSRPLSPEAFVEFVQDEREVKLLDEKSAKHKSPIWLLRGNLHQD